jgi:hypothetical protein
MEPCDTTARVSFHLLLQQVNGHGAACFAHLSPAGHHTVCCSRRARAERENSRIASTDSLSRMIPKSGNRFSEKIMGQC